MLTPLVEGAGAPVGAASPRPVVSATPSKGLADGQVITVSGHGFKAHESVAIVECEPTATTPAGCNISRFKYVTTSASGTIDAKWVAMRYVQVGLTTLDCAAPGGCLLGVGQLGGSSQDTGTKISFNPAAAARWPALKVTPSHGIADGSLLELRASGFAPGTIAGVSECAGRTTAPVSCEGAPFGEDGTVSAAGVFTTTVVALRDVSAFGKVVDCSKPGVCELVVTGSQSDGVQLARAGLRIDASLPPVRPKLHLSQATGVADGQIVQVTGTGYVPGSYVGIAECLVGATATLGSCDLHDVTFVDSSATGTVSVDFALTWHLSVAGKTHDCAVKGTCSLVVAPVTSFAAEETEQTGSVRLSFSPSAAPVRPAVELSASTGLADGQAVSVTATGFVPDAAVELAECVVAPTFTCSSADTAHAIASSAGDVNVRFPVVRKLGDRHADCATATCAMEVTNLGDSYEFGTHRLSFDPTATPIRPTLDVTPSTGLADGQVVTATGSGFEPGALVELVECPTTVTVAMCGGGYYGQDAVVADASGTFDAGYAVARFTYVGAKRVDCAAVTCQLHAVNQGDIDQERGVTISFG